MKKLICAIAVMTLLSSCGGESDNFKNAKIHKCNMIKYANEIKAGKDSEAKLKEATEFFEISRDFCINDDGMKDFEERINQVTCE
ncbi:MAG: hypothetical protein IAF38_22860 [Bacteroidia bacterium]|nr:hypothetical protein [Bacteroidia bacterium]